MAAAGASVLALSSAAAWYWWPAGGRKDDEAKRSSRQSPDDRERRARLEAAKNIEDQSPEVQRKYYKGRIMTARATLATRRTALQQLEEARTRAAKDAGSDPERVSKLDEKIAASKRRIEQDQKRIGLYMTQVARLGAAEP